MFSCVRNSRPQSGVSVHVARSRPSDPLLRAGVQLGAEAPERIDARQPEGYSSATKGLSGYPNVR